MITSSRLVVSSLVAASLALFACSSETTSFDPNQAVTSPTKSSADGGAADGKTVKSDTISTDVCERLCQRQEECDSATDEETCVAKCKNTNSTFLSKLRGDFQGALATCLDNAACRDIDSGEAIDSCVDESQARVSLSDAATSYCEAAEKAYDTCGSTLDKASCFDDAKIYSDATLADAKKCFAKACTDINACVTAAFGGSSTTTTTDDPPPPPPPPPPATCQPQNHWDSASCNSCMGALCCEEDAACANDSSCSSFLSCYSACTTSSCESYCINTYPTGAQLAVNLATCMNDSCPASCGN